MADAISGVGVGEGCRVCVATGASVGSEGVFWGACGCAGAFIVGIVVFVGIVGVALAATGDGFSG